MRPRLHALGAVLAVVAVAGPIDVVLLRQLG